MNPLIETQIERITSQIAELAKVLEENERNLDVERGEKDDLRQGQWEARRESATLQRIEKQYDALHGEHAKLVGERKTLKDGLSKILAYVKLVDGGLKP
jgi:hypothetical protein